MKEIILPTELMAFFILNMFGHDSALHDFSTSSELGKGRVLNVLRTPPSAPGSGSFSTGSWSGKGGGDEKLVTATTSVYASTVGPTLYACLESTGFFDIARNDVTRSDSFIIVDAKLAMGVIFSGTGIANRDMGIAPGFIYLPERTYSPFEFEVIERGTIDSKGYAQDKISYKHYTEPLEIKITRAFGSFNCNITRNGVVTAYNLLSSRRELEGKALNMISAYPDVLDAFMSNTVSTSITNYVDYIQLLLDGADSRYTSILTDYKTFGCMIAKKDGAEEDVKVDTLIARGKEFLRITITTFWADFNGFEPPTSMLANIPTILTKIDEIQSFFALIYKAILCAVGTAVKAGLYSCTPPPIAEVEDLNNFYLANKSQLEMFVYEYMVSSMNFGNTAADTLKNKCNNFIKETTDRSTEQLTTFINFLQIVSDTLIDKETDKKEIQEQEENEIVYVENSKDNEKYIRVLTDLPIIAGKTLPVLSELINLVNATLLILFNGKVQEPDYTTILTDAVGIDNVAIVKGLLSPGTVNEVTDDKVILLQTVFLDVINRLDSDQLENLIKTKVQGKNKQLFGEITLGGGGQSGGAKKKPEYLFVFSDAVAFFTQLTNQNRLTKMKAKFKELFDKTNVLPAFYTDLIIKPKDTNALAWKIDFNTVFLGFFENGANLPITDDNMIASIDSGVIFPQIPSNVIDDLTLDNVLIDRFNLIDRSKITSLKELGDSWLAPPATPSNKFKEIIEKITALNLPGIFVEPDEGSDIFWRFEQGYIYLLKCVMLYDVLVLKEAPTGCNTLEVNGFIAPGQAICPIPDDIQLNKFLRLFFSCTTRYNDLLTKIDELNKNGSVLSGPQKICTGYALGSILTSVMTEMHPIISSFKNSALLNIETTEISRILAKKANASTILQSSTFGDNDTKLYNKFVNWVDNNNFQRENNTVFSHNENINVSLGTSLGQDTKWRKALLTDINAQYGGEGKFYINNAVNAPSALGKLGRGYFCPAASIMDNQSTCSTKTSAEANEGFEVGVMDFVIHDGRPFGEQTGIPPKMEYRVRVVQSADNSTCKIGAYLKIEGKYLINVADADIWAGILPNEKKLAWPSRVDVHPPITVPLNSTRANTIPMDAKTCLRDIFTTIDSPAFKDYNTSGFQSLIDALEKPDALPLRRLILESSFVKGLGDFLQEASGFVENSGYEAIPSTKPVPPFIQTPNNGRLQLNNDRPSSVRAILLVLYGKGSINPNVIAGFLTEMKDKKKIPKSKYALAGRLTRVGGGRNTKKTKASKRNKNTRRIKMKTRMNKRSKRQKRLKVRKTRKVLHRVK